MNKSAEQAYIAAFLGTCEQAGLDKEASASLLKQAGLGDIFGHDPQWYGAETSWYRPYDKQDEPQEPDVEQPKGIYHGIRIRDEDKRSLLSRIFGHSKSSIPRSRVAEIVAALRAAGVDVKEPDEDDEELEFGYPVGAGYAGSRLTSGGRREGAYLPKELRQTIDNILYGDG